MRTRTGPAWATARRILPSCGTWHSTSCRRMARRKRCAASFSGPDGTMPISPASLLYSEVQLPWQAGLFDTWVADCPLSLTSPNAPSKRDLLGTVMLSVLAGHRRYAHITTLRCDPVNPPLLGMRKVVSEDLVRRG